jgi:AraC-like DNA-binding protein
LYCGSRAKPDRYLCRLALYSRSRIIGTVINHGRDTIRPYKSQKAFTDGVRGLAPAVQFAIDPTCYRNGNLHAKRFTGRDAMLTSGTGTKQMQKYLYEKIRPPLQLAATIECFWRLLVPTMPPPDEMLSAEGRAEILFQFEGKSQAFVPGVNIPFACTSSWIVRPYAHALRAKQIGVSASAMIGVRFRPAGWSAFQGNYHTDQDTPSLMVLRDFYTPSDVCRLEQQLYETLYTSYWVTPLISFFTPRLNCHFHAQRISYAVHQFQQKQVSIAALAYQLNLSERQFTRVFRNLVGLSPVQFSRIARMDRVLYAPDYRQDVSLQKMAVRYGYHDASHLAHEFRDLVGMSMSEYFGNPHALIAQKNPQDDFSLGCPTRS